MAPHVTANQLDKRFGAKSVLQQVTAEIGPGQIVGVLGKNGAGKTTLLELVLGFTMPSAGEVAVFGHASARMPDEIKARIGFVPQQDELIEQITGADQLALVGSFYRTWDRAFILELGRRWQLDLDERIKSMSIGQRQKLSIMLALGHRPDLLVLDEPVASLDPVARRQFLEQIVEVAADGQRSVLFSSHIVSDVERLANEIWILKDGRLDWMGDIDSLKESVVRIRIHSQCELAEALPIPGVLRFERSGGEGIAVVRGWSESHRANLARQVGASLSVEPLSLEEIFLEMHG